MGCAYRYFGVGLDVNFSAAIRPLYGAVTLAVGEGVAESMKCCDYTLSFNFGRDSLEYAAVISFIGQFLGCYIAQAKGIDADSPRPLTQAIVL